MRTTEEQKWALVRFIQQHPVMLTNNISNDCQEKDVNHLWKIVTQQLNEMGPEQKTEKLWKRYWMELLIAVKKQLSRASIKTKGGGKCSNKRLVGADLALAEMIRSYAIEEPEASIPESIMITDQEEENKNNNSYKPTNKYQIRSDIEYYNAKIELQVKDMEQDEAHHARMAVQYAMLYDNILQFFDILGDMFNAVRHYTYN